MGDTLTRSKFAASLAALALGLTLAGCGDTDNPESDGTATTANGSASPSTNETTSGSSDSPASTPDPSASGDWWPEQPDKMATGQEFPDDYEPATLEHPAHNVPKPVMPEAASQETEAGAQAFLDYYDHAGWYAYQTGDTSYLRATTSDHCTKCLEEANVVERVYSGGDWAVGRDERATIIKNTFVKDSKGYYTMAVSASNNGALLIQNGEVTREFQPYNDTKNIDVNLNYKNGEWVYLTASLRGE